jgi:shikimate dehydrogenase
LTHADRAARPLAAFALGPSGLPSRILALSWGSWGTYGAAARGRETADGQPTTGDLLDVYRVRTISKSTRRFGLAGSPVGRSPSPALHAAAYRAAAIDAVYLPLATRDVDDLAAIAGPLGAFGLEGFGVTIPLKERIAARCGSLDRYAACGSVNTVDAGPPRWRGYNTDAPAALSLLREHVVLSGAAIAVAGAGGTARAIAAALVAAGAHVTLFHRGAGGEATARAAGASSAPWERLSGASWDVLVQATPLGAAGEEVVPEASLRGRMVLDAAYGRQETPLVRAARRRGLAVADGFDLLTAQAMRQFEILTGRTVEAGVWAAAAAPYREGSNA